MVFRKSILMILLFLSLVFGAERVVDFLFENAASIDACLDNGGAWDYESKECHHA